MTLTGHEYKTSNLKSKELTNYTKKNLCPYCSFKIYMVTHNKLYGDTFHDSVIFYTITGERNGVTCHRIHYTRSAKHYK